MKRLKKINSIWGSNSQRLITIVIVIGIALVGLHYLVGSHATGPYTSATADSGSVVSPAAKQACTGSSDGNCVKFGTVASSGTGINPTPTGPSTPSGGWTTDFADDFNAPLGTASGDDNYWYPMENFVPLSTTNANGYNSYESEDYSPAQVSVSGGNLVLTAKYDPNTNSNGAGVSYLSGVASTPTNNSGYKGFTWSPGGGQTWAFEVDCQFPVNTGELFNAWWTSSQTGWNDERDFFEGKTSSDLIDTDWIYNTGGEIANLYNDLLPFDPSAAMHRYTYIVYPNQSWSLYVDGVLQTAVNGNGIAPVQSSNDDPMLLILNYALNGTTFTSGTRSFKINSVAVYEDSNNAGQGYVGGGVAPGTVIN